uniref:Uncharacterized protein n=1 Tax=viral metagenome TaxID=1070528 RepID=A0A6C0IDU7_9ZZZZ
MRKHNVYFLWMDLFKYLRFQNMVLEKTVG